MPENVNFFAKDRPIEDILFSNIKYKVPRYQRPYSWNIDQVSEFWNDLISSRYPYFIGSFIFNYETEKETGFVDIIDGQQRLLTITIFIAAIRDLANSLDPKYADRYQRQCIGIEDRRGNQTYRILCGESTREYYENLIQKDGNMTTRAQPENEEENKIYQNYIYLKNKLENELNRFDNNSDKISHLQKLREKVADLIAIDIRIESEENAYEIFETTNARGLDLSVADLLKNLIFKEITADEGRDTAKEMWSEIVENIQETNFEHKRFIRYFWLSKYPFVNEKNLFREIKREITDYQNLLLDIYESADIFNKLLEGTKNDFIEYRHGIEIYKSLFAIRIMNVTQCYMFLLSVFRNYDKLNTDPMNIIRFIEKFSFVYSEVSKLPTNKIERIYSKYAKNLDVIVNTQQAKKVPGKIQSLFEGLKKQLKAEKPSFETFREKFDNIVYRNSEKSRRIIKYILTEINNLNETGEHEIDFFNVNIEHLMPQKPNKEWGLSVKEIKPYVNKLGNLTLLHKKLNSKIGNKIISKKIDSLEESSLPITKQIVKQLKAEDYVWNEDKINTRHDNFAELAYSNIWDF